MVEENIENKTANVDNQSVEDEKKEEKEDTPDTVEKAQEEWQDILGSGSIMKKTIRTGKPDSRPQRLQICEINYECKLENGILVEKCNNFIMQLGDCDVIQGLDLAIGLMNVEEICELKIEPRLAYGTKGLPPLIPADEKIFYHVELVSVKDEEEAEKLSINERKTIGNKKRERGNWWYGRGENALAIQCYRRALDYLDELEGGVKMGDSEEKADISDGELQNLLEDRLNVCNNMAAAQIKLGLYDPALNSLETVLRCQPHNVKALYRKAKIYRAKNEYNMSLKFLQKANEVSPDDTDIHIPS
ncbi:Tetratricopeptide repeat [Popillia japonica]|uniref:peptidylprolyl isomerase n=1 Tax=Popillia japonica TaxID=7064 RepID=A0AAW1JZK0_POPJA